MSSTDTDWIVPGAEIVVYRHTPGKVDDNLRRTTVATVAKQSFTVEGLAERIRLATMETKTIGGSWSGYCYIAIRPDSPKVAELDEEAAARKVLARALDAVENWNTGRGRRDPKRVQAAIDALTALRDTL